MRVFVVSLFALGVLLWSQAPTVNAGGSVSAQVSALEDESSALTKTAANPASSLITLHSAAAYSFEKITRQNTTDGAVHVALKGWAKPDWMADPKKESRRVDTSELTNILGRTLRTTDVPVPWQKEMYRDYWTGKSMQEQGFVRRDGDNGREILTPKEMGAYLYTPMKPAGVFLNKEIQTIIRFIGPKFAAGTSLHEFDHASSDINGELDPKNVLPAEEHAFMVQYHYLRTIDPDGQILARLRVMFDKSNPFVPDVVPDYLEHLATILRYGDQGDWEGLVKAFGYSKQAGQLPPHVTRS